MADSSFGSGDREVTVRSNGSSPMAATDADRETYLRLVLEGFEAGSFDAYEYTQRVQAIDHANSVEEMARLAQVQTGEVPDARRPALDPVDLAVMASRTPGSRSPRTVQKGKSSSRYTALIVVVLLFIVLLGLGVWLSARVHGTSSSPSGAAIEPVSVSLYASPLEVPPSPLSPRR